MTIYRRPVQLTGLAVALSLTLAACGSSSSPSSSSSSASSSSSSSVLAAGGDVTQIASTAAPTPGGTIEYGAEQEPPCLTGGWVQQAYIARQMSDSLVSQADAGKIVPWLAQSWTVTNGGKTYTFHLKPGVKFTDGTPLNAAAVKFNYDYFLNARTGNGTWESYLTGKFVSARVIDDLTVQINLNQPYAPFLSTISQGHFGIQSPKALARGLAANCVDPVGSGPFIVQKWNRGNDLILVRNPSYDSAPANAKHQGPAYVDRIVWKFLANNTVRYGSLTSGESDLIYDIPAVDWAAAQQSYQVERYSVPGTPVRLSLNVTRAPFNDLKVRQAFGYASDRQAAVANAYQGSVPFNGNGALVRSTPDYDASLANPYPYDVARANALLDQAGWTTRNAQGIRTRDGQELNVKLVYPTGSLLSSDGTTVLETIQQQAKAAGFNVTLVPATQTEVFGGRYSTPDSYDAFPSYWVAPTAGVLYINWRQNLKATPNGNNASFYNNPELERTIFDADASPDPATQKTLYAKAQQIIADNAVNLGLVPLVTSLAISKKLHGVWIEDTQGEPIFSDAYFSK